MFPEKENYMLQYFGELIFCVCDCDDGVYITKPWNQLESVLHLDRSKKIVLVKIRSH